MKDLKKTLNLILIIALVFSVCLAASACSDSTERTDYNIYYSSSDATDILYKSYSMSQSETKDKYTKVSELFAQMFDTDYTEDGYYSAKPSQVAINDYVVSSDGLLSIDFSVEYNDLSNVQEIILRSAVVLTMIQIDGIESVSFTVAGEDLLNEDGDAVGEMTADKFVNILLNEQDMLRDSAEVRLFFANEEGTALVPVVYTFEIDNKNTSMEEYIVDMLIAGPEEGSGVCPTISSDVELINVTTTDGTCYVNFGSSFLEQEQPVSDELLIYSIVNSLCTLSYVSGVMFQIDGQPATLLHSVTDLSQTFTRNYSLEE